MFSQSKFAKTLRGLVLGLGFAIQVAAPVALPVAGIVTTAAVVTGCAQTQFAGYVHASNDDRKAVDNGQYNVNATATVAIVQNPDINGGKISLRALIKIQKYSLSCQDQIDAQAAGGIQSGVNGAVPYGAAGAGTGPAAAAAFAGASASSYAIYGAGAYLLPGAVNGLVTGSYALASAKGSCTRDFWEDIRNNDRDFAGTHVEILYAGKKWGNSAPPALPVPQQEQQPPIDPRRR